MSEEYKKANPFDLKKHPLSIDLYGDKPNKELEKSILKAGIYQPIVITPENVIISGHSRNQIARIHDFKEVPVIVRHDLTDPLDIEEAVIRSNEQREKTKEQKTREYKALVRIERAKGLQRMSDGGRQSPADEALEEEGQANLPDLVSDQSTGQSRDIAAQAVGMSGRSAEEAAKVVDRIDELREAGEVEKADELSQALEKSVSGAVKLMNKDNPKPEAKTGPVDGLKRQVPDYLEGVFSEVEIFDDYVKSLRSVLRQASSMAGTPAGAFLRVDDLKADITNAVNTIKFAKPFTECPTCKREVKEGCKNCHGSGFITKRHYGESSGSGTLCNEERDWLGARK